MVTVARGPPRSLGFPHHVPPPLFQLWLLDDSWAPAALSLGLGGPDGQDHGPYCFSVLGGHGASHVFSVGLGSELAVWERSFQRAALLEVQRAGVSATRCSLRKPARGLKHK